MQHSLTTQRAQPALKHNNTFLTVGLIAALLFALLTVGVVVAEPVTRLDERLLTFFGNLAKEAPDWLTRASTWYQEFSSAGLGFIAAALIAYFLVSGRTRRFYLMLASVGGIELLWFALMFAIGRPRPVEVIIWGGVNLPSYPSGHAMFNVAFYGALLYIFYGKIESRPGRRLFLGSVIFLLLLTGINRLLFSVHYFSDVVGGYLIGIAWTVAALWMVEWFLNRKEREESGSAAE